MPTTNDSDSSLRFPILIGDIGGTNARFSIVPDAQSEASEPVIVQTANFATIDDAIRSAVLDRSSIRPNSAVLAVAGPVDSDEIQLTNCPWIVKPRQMIANLGLSDIVVLNDFEAQALAVVALGEEHMEKIGGGAPELRCRLIVGVVVPGLSRGLVREFEDDHAVGEGLALAGGHRVAARQELSAISFQRRRGERGVLLVGFGVVDPHGADHICGHGLLLGSGRAYRFIEAGSRQISVVIAVVAHKVTTDKRNGS